MAKGDEGMDPVMAKLVAALEAVASRPSEENREIQQRLTEALERVSEAQIQGAKLIAQETRRAARPSNEVVPMVSVFNLRGNLLDDYQKPRLACRMFLPWEADEDSLTREEVELLNLIPFCHGEWTLTRHDDTQILIRVTVELDLNKTRPTRVLINHDTAFNQEYFKEMPPLRVWLRQILAQSDEPEVVKQAAAILTTEEEKALIRAGKLTVSV